MSRKSVVFMTTVIFALLAVGAVFAADTTPKPGTPEDNACNPGGVLYREQNQDGCPTLWYWKAGWFLARFLTGDISRANFPQEFVSVLPPEEKPRPMICSGMGGAFVNVNFKNNSSGTVNVYWRDASCNEISYSTLTSGSGYSQGTFANHVWVVRDSNQKLLYCFKAAVTANVNITDTPQDYC